MVSSSRGKGMLPYIMAGENKREAVSVSGDTGDGDCFTLPPGPWQGFGKEGNETRTVK